MAEKRNSGNARPDNGVESGRDDVSHDGTGEVPEHVVDEAERLTRLARDAADENEREAYLTERADLLADYEFTARVRDEDRAVLVLHPAEWVEDGAVQPAQIDDLERGIERPLEGVGTSDDWEAIHAHNTDLAAAVEAEYGGDHGANAHELGAFMSNHYLKPIEDATADELEEFVSEYYPRNTWTTDRQQAIVRASVRRVFDCADTEAPVDASAWEQS